MACDPASAARAGRRCAAHRARLLLRTRLRVPFAELARRRSAAASRHARPRMDGHGSMERRRAALPLLSSTIVDLRRVARADAAVLRGADRFYRCRAARCRNRNVSAGARLRLYCRRASRFSHLHRKPLHALHRFRAHCLWRVTRCRVDSAAASRSAARETRHRRDRRAYRIALAHQCTSGGHRHLHAAADCRPAHRLRALPAIKNNRAAAADPFRRRRCARARARRVLPRTRSVRAPLCTGRYGHHRQHARRGQFPFRPHRRRSARSGAPHREPHRGRHAHRHTHRSRGSVRNAPEASAH